MAVTETPVETLADADHADGTATRAQPTGLAAILGTGDHKVLGRLFIVTSLAYGFAVVVLGQLFAIEMLAPATLDIFTQGTVGQAFSFYRVAMVLLVAMPLVIGVAYVVVPLQVGARAIAFPRAAAAAWWGWLLGSGCLVAAHLLQGTGTEPSQTADLLLVTATGLVTVALLLASICLATTVLALRHVGLSIDRIPMFSWSVLVSALVWLLTLPVLVGTLVLLYVDRRHAGGALRAAQVPVNLEWFLRNPQVYVLAVPVLGFVADVLATAAGTRIAPRSVVIGAIGAMGVVGIGSFLATAGIDELETAGVVAMSLLAVLPALAVLGLVGDLFRRGTFTASAPVAYAVSALLVLLLGLVAGALGAIPATEAIGTIYDLGVTHAIVLASIIASIGGVHWWATKIGRQPADEKLGLGSALLLLVGSTVVVVGDLVSGLFGEGVELNADWSGGIEAANVAVALGTAVVALGVLLAAVSLLPLLKESDDEVPADPWEGQTLEWLAPSPPPLANFTGDLPEITSAEPLVDLREEK